jgi:hypothetical protein
MEVNGQKLDITALLKEAYAALASDGLPDMPA